VSLRLQRGGDGNRAATPIRDERDSQNYNGHAGASATTTSPQASILSLKTCALFNTHECRNISVYACDR
jgi:hypothetical protein